MVICLTGRTALCKLSVRANNPFFLRSHTVRTGVSPDTGSVISIFPGLSIPVHKEHRLCVSTHSILPPQSFCWEARYLFGPRSPKLTQPWVNWDWHLSEGAAQIRLLWVYACGQLSWMPIAVEGPRPLWVAQCFSGFCESLDSWFCRSHREPASRSPPCVSFASSYVFVCLFLRLGTGQGYLSM